MCEITHTINIKNILNILKEKWEYLILFALSLLFFQFNIRLLYFLDDLYLARNNDAWFYLSFILHPKELFTIGSYYQWDRLSYELPGYILFKLFSPIQAQYILHFAFIIVTIFSFFFISCYFFSKKTALISSILMLSFTPFLMLMGTNYCPSTLTYFLLSLLMVVTISNNNKIYIKLFLAGIFFACMILSQPISIFVYITALGGVYYLLTKNWNKTQHIYGLISSFIGILGVLILFSIIFYLLTDSFSFLKATILFLMQNNIQGALWYHPWYYWAEPLHYIIFIFFILSIIWVLISKYKLKIQNYRLIFPFFFITSCLFYILMSTQWSILFEVFVALLIPLLFFSINSFIDNYIRKIGTDLFAIFLVFELVVLCLPNILFIINSNILLKFLDLFLIKDPILSDTYYYLLNFYYLLISTFLIFMVLLLISHFKKFPQNKKINIILILCMMCIFINFAALNVVSERDLFMKNPKKQIDSFENGFLSVVESIHFIHTETELTNRKIVWYDEKEKNSKGDYYGGLFETVGYSAISYRYNFPEYNLDNITKICSDASKQNCGENTLIILSTDPNIFQKIQNNFNKKNLTAIALKSKNVMNGNINFNITLAKVFCGSNICSRLSNNASKINLSLLYAIEVNNNTFKSKFEQNCYNGLCYRESESGSIILLARTNSDHIASKFFILPINSTKGQNIITKVTYSEEVKTLNGLNIFIQDNDYNIIGDNLNERLFSETDGRNYSVYNEFTLPQPNIPIRIVMSASDYQQHVLPLKIDLYQEKV